MKKIISMIMMTVLLITSNTILAVPAYPKPVKVQQPDGSFVTISLRGDEWLHFYTTVDGYSIVKNDAGFYVYAEKQNGQLKATAMVAHDAEHRQAAELSFLAGKEKCLRPEMSAEVAAMKQQVEGLEAAKRAAWRSSVNGHRAGKYDYTNFRGLVILIEFNDKSFSRSDYKTIMNDMINKENYTGYGSQVFTGSVRDYFSDNSLSKFQPQFDVFGPYKVSNSVYEGSNNSVSILNNAINMADEEINFKDYDRDNNGKVDLIYFIVAGNGSNYDGNDDRFWWPHRSILTTTSRQYLYKDGVLLWDYASSVELYGFTTMPGTVKIDGIGTICHEFSHVLGLPDFYDTDYEKNGQSNDPGTWSVMAGGSYKNEGRTPVGYSLYERWSVGFCDAPEVVQKGDYSLDALHKEQKGYMIKTPTNGEYFLLENRQQSTFKWDRYLPGSGLLVHRVEGEGNLFWQNNTINAYSSHNYYEVVRANGAHKDANGDYTSTADDLFPSKNKTSLTNTSSPANLKTFKGVNNALALSNIKQTNGIITFKVDGYEVQSVTIEPAAIPELGIGLSQQLTAIISPNYAETTISWESKDTKIATVDENGMVKGVAAGTCTITATSANGKAGTCMVTVKEMMPYSIAEFKQKEMGSVQILKLTNAEVLGAYQKTAYIRDASGCITLANMDLGLKQNDIVNGSLMAKVNQSNNMWQAVGTELTNSGGLTITAGSEPTPREVSISDLTEADYGDYVVVKAGKLKSDGGVWVVDENNTKMARLYNRLQISGITLKNYDGNYYDIPAIYGTDVLNNKVINELYMLKSPTKVEDPTGIKLIDYSTQEKENIYNLQGQRVAKDYKGLIIRDGRKYINK